MCLAGTPARYGTVWAASLVVGRAPSPASRVAATENQPHATSFNPPDTPRPQRPQRFSFWLEPFVSAYRCTTPNPPPIALE